MKCNNLSNSSHNKRLIVKELAVAIWGTVELRGRSVSGKERPTRNAEAKPALTPYKVKTVSIALHHSRRRL